MSADVIHLKHRQKPKPGPDCGEPPLHCEHCGHIAFYLFKSALVCAGCHLEIQNVEVKLK